MKLDSEKTLQVFTIGHSNRSFEEFLSLLKEFGICVVADIRRYPSSRKFPHFNREVLHKLLIEVKIEYLWLEALGGRRHIGKDNKSINCGLKSPGFRNYADHMASDEFRTAVQELLSTTARSRVAVMCAEKFYWKCHRRLLSDYLIAQSIGVEHIVESGKLQPHKLSAGAVITGDTKAIYPPPTAGENKVQELFQP